MKLSEAIRAGARMGPQVKFSYVEKASDGRIFSCALGAAGLAAFGPLFKEGKMSFALSEKFPVMRQVVICPERGSLCELAVAIVRLNDFYRWSREQIADWVESVERASEPPAHELSGRGPGSEVPDFDPSRNSAAPAEAPAC